VGDIGEVEDVDGAATEEAGLVAIGAGAPGLGPPGETVFAAGGLGTGVFVAGELITGELVPGESCETPGVLKSRNENGKANNRPIKLLSARNILVLLPIKGQVTRRR